jgi:hypothetical protein
MAGPLCSLFGRLSGLRRDISASGLRRLLTACLGPWSSQIEMNASASRPIPWISGSVLPRLGGRLLVRLLDARV